MIVGLTGVLESQGVDAAVIRVGGISLRVGMPSSTLSRLGAPGDEVQLHTHLHFKDDNIALYGFGSHEELRLFEMLIGVAGVGPKAGLALLSFLSPQELALAIGTGNADILTKVPGVGKKMAGRLVLELRSKLESAGLAETVPPQGADSDVVAALLSLGYSATEAARALATISLSPDLPPEEMLRQVLQHLARE